MPSIIQVAKVATTITLAATCTGCYHFAFEHRPEPPGPRAGAEPGPRLVTYQERAPTYINGFIGTGRIDTSRYCADPVRTELRVTAIDVLISVGTLLIYTPHTLYVTCEVGDAPPPSADD